MHSHLLAPVTVCSTAGAPRPPQEPPPGWRYVSGDGAAYYRRDADNTTLNHNPYVVAGFA